MRQEQINKEVIFKLIVALSPILGIEQVNEFIGQLEQLDNAEPIVTSHIQKLR